MSDIRVLVAGASIAGPALAHWLRRRGAEVTVVERGPGLRPGGQAVDARGVAREVIRRMGLDAAVRAAHTDTAGAYTVDADGNVLETFRADDDGGDGYIAEIEILRGDLCQVLYDDTRDGVEYVFGDRIAELVQDADGVDVTFAGGERRRFDLVVGADGLHSALRGMVFGPRERFVRHLGLVLAFYSVPNEFGLDQWLLEYKEPGRSALLRPIHDATRAMAMFSFASAEFDVDYRDIEAQKRLLREQVTGLGWLTPRILAHLDDTPDFYLDQVAQVVMVCCIRRARRWRSVLAEEAERVRRPQATRPNINRSAFAGFRFPPEVITAAVRWYLRYGLSYRDLEELLAERGIEVDHVTVYRWVQRFTPLFADAARPLRHAPGDRWFVDETYVKVAGRWRYLYRAIDQYGQVIDVLLSEQRDTAAAHRFFVRALDHGPKPVEVTTDKAGPYLRVLDELVPAAAHITEQYGNNPIEADHARLKARLRPMRGLKRFRSAAVIAAGHAFAQNLRRGHYEVATDISPPLRLATAFSELALAM